MKEEGCAEGTQHPEVAGKDEECSQISLVQVQCSQALDCSVLCWINFRSILMELREFSN